MHSAVQWSLPVSGHFARLPASNLLADVTKVDSELTMTVRPRVTAATGPDAMAHGIEAFISVNVNPYSDGHALQAIRLIGGALKRVVQNGSDKEARINMAYESYLAGLAFFLMPALAPFIPWPIGWVDRFILRTENTVRYSSPMSLGIYGTAVLPDWPLFCRH